MKAVIQRVTRASVNVDGQLVGQIGPGIVTLFGVQKGDTTEMVEKICQKILNFRMFADENGKMNQSLLDIGGQHLIVSQFTLAANCQRGRRPSFDSAGDPDQAEKFYNKFVKLSNDAVATSTGVFGADMKVQLENDGPVTFIFELSAD